MHEADRREESRQDDAPAQAPTTGGWVLTEEQWWRLAGFSREELQRLTFVRWLHRTGRLSEWEGRQPSPRPTPA